MYRPTTHGGYAFDEVSSALQKEIRRGNETDALYWALELCPEFEAFLWRRLEVIVHEDIGIANPPLLLMIPQLAERFLLMRETRNDGAEILILTNVILLLCRSPKTRVSDELQCVVVDSIQRGEMHLSIPDYAKDKHTASGKALGRGMEHFLSEGAVLSQSLDCPWGSKPEAVACDSHNRYSADAWMRWLRGIKGLNWPQRKKAGSKKPGTLFDNNEPDPD